MVTEKPQLAQRVMCAAKTACRCGLGPTVPGNRMLDITDQPLRDPPRLLDARLDDAAVDPRPRLGIKSVPTKAAIGFYAKIRHPFRPSSMHLPGSARAGILEISEAPRKAAKLGGI